MKIRRKIFVGSMGWLIFWIICLWPIAIYYYLDNRELVELNCLD